MTYKVVPFTASIASNANASAAAAQLEALIQTYTSEGWEYVQLERVDTFVAGDKGCFGFGATAGHNTSIAMAVFRK